MISPSSDHEERSDRNSAFEAGNGDGVGHGRLLRGHVVVLVEVVMPLPLPLIQLAARSFEDVVKIDKPSQCTSQIEVEPRPVISPVALGL
jgi:hypothetical protein